jgi:hypothetical protein
MVVASCDSDACLFSGGRNSWPQRAECAPAQLWTGRRSCFNQEAEQLSRPTLVARGAMHGVCSFWSCRKQNFNVVHDSNVTCTALHGTSIMVSITRLFPSFDGSRNLFRRNRGPRSPVTKMHTPPGIGIRRARWPILLPNLNPHSNYTGLHYQLARTTRTSPVSRQ